MKKIKRYWLFCFDWGKKPSDFEVGATWIFVIIAFPIWIIPYLIYLGIGEIGKTLNNVKEGEVEEDEYEEKYY